jgi:hypothetical protein
MMNGTTLAACREPITYPRDAVVTVEEVAAALRVSVPTVKRMDFPTIYIGRQSRYLWGQLLDHLAEIAA